MNRIRIIALLVCLALVFSVVGCTSATQDAADDTASADTEATDDTGKTEDVGQIETDVAEDQTVGGPSYGGTLTCWIQDATSEPASPDRRQGFAVSSHFLDSMLERLAVADFETYGPRGTNDYGFLSLEFVPEQYLTGQLLESWDVSPEKAVWHVREGVMWTPNEDQISRGLMDGPREVTAQDIVDWLEFFKEGATANDFFKVIKSLKAVDKYTIECEWVSFQPVTMIYTCLLGAHVQFCAPESLAADPDKWEDVIGTGPFVFKEYVPGAHMTYERNPNYWDTTTVDGVEYEFPFVDEMVCPIIPDESTRISALRTGALDYCREVPVTYWESLDQTNPDLQSIKFPSVYNYCCHIRCDGDGPTSNTDVRRALMVATDQSAFIEANGTGGLDIQVNQWPFYTEDPDMYIPLDELPEESKILFEYDADTTPELAKQMLTDAGYPDGFTLDVDILAEPAYEDRAAMLKDQWAKIGVDINIIANDSTKQWAYFTNREFGDVLMLMYGIGNPVTAYNFYTSTGWLCIGNWKNDEFDSIMAEVGSMTDVEERNEKLTEAGLIFLNDCPVIPLTSQVTALYWHPWVKNFYGEVNFNQMDNHAALARVWIDEELKESMGY